MSRLLLLLSVLTVSTLLPAQFQIGHTSITFTDPARNNRAILTDIYYPADVAGDNVPLAAGQFPVIQFGHGFVMVWSAYQNFWETFVPEGYILCFPRTEGSFSPVHTEFAKDLAFLCSAMEAEKVNAASLFFGHIQPRYCVMGHSMGGGCSVLAHQYNTNLIKCVATFAPANTNPSAIAVASEISVPSLTFAGSYDCIAPPAQQALLIFEALDSAACKIYVNLEGGSHCQFANANTNCNLGEVLSGCSNPPISATAQQALTTSLLLLWLNTYLKETPGFLTPFLDLLADANGFSAINHCKGVTGLDAPVMAGLEFEILTNPILKDELVAQLIGSDMDTPVDFFVYDVSGTLVKNFLQYPVGAEGSVRLPTGSLQKGMYFLVALGKDGRTAVRKFVKL